MIQETQEKIDGLNEDKRNSKRLEKNDDQTEATIDNI